MDCRSNMPLRQCFVSLEDCRHIKLEPRFDDPQDFSRLSLDEAVELPDLSPRIKREIIYPQQLALHSSSKLVNPEEQSSVTIGNNSVDPLELIPYVKQEGEESPRDNGELDVVRWLPLMMFEEVDPRDLMTTVKSREDRKLEAVMKSFERMEKRSRTKTGNVKQRRVQSTVGESGVNRINRPMSTRRPVDPLAMRSRTKSKPINIKELPLQIKKKTVDQNSKTREDRKLEAIMKTFERLEKSSRRTNGYHKTTLKPREVHSTVDESNDRRPPSTHKSPGRVAVRSRVEASEGTPRTVENEATRFLQLLPQMTCEEVSPDDLITVVKTREERKLEAVMKTFERLEKSSRQKNGCRKAKLKSRRVLPTVDGSKGLPSSTVISAVAIVSRKPVLTLAVPIVSSKPIDHRGVQPRIKLEPIDPDDYEAHSDERVGSF